MGIGNAALGGVQAPHVQGLITPHGDREPQRQMPTHSDLTDSLPLMGIGNSPSSFDYLRSELTKSMQKHPGTARICA